MTRPKTIQKRIRELRALVKVSELRALEKNLLEDEAHSLLMAIKYHRANSKQKK